MPAESLACPNCGAPLTHLGATGSLICDHCGSLIAVQPSAGPDQRVESNQAPRERPALRELASVTLGPANAARIIQLLRDHYGLQGSHPADLPEVRQWLEQGKKIQAIKAYRNATGQGLVEAKDAVEDLERQLYPNRRQNAAQAGGLAGRGAFGCGSCLLVLVTDMHSGTDSDG